MDIYFESNCKHIIDRVQAGISNFGSDDVCCDPIYCCFENHADSAKIFFATYWSEFQSALNFIDAYDTRIDWNSLDWESIISIVFTVIAGEIEDYND